MLFRSIASRGRRFVPYFWSSRNAGEVVCDLSAFESEIFFNPGLSGTFVPEATWSFVDADAPSRGGTSLLGEPVKVKRH